MDSFTECQITSNKRFLGFAEYENFVKVPQGHITGEILLGRIPKALVELSHRILPSWKPKIVPCILGTSIICMIVARSRVASKISLKDRCGSERKEIIDWKNLCTLESGNLAMH